MLKQEKYLNAGLDETLTNCREKLQKLQKEENETQN